MADSVTVRVEGLQALAAKLRSLGPSIGRNALRAGVRAGSKVVKDAAARAAPVDTGRLKKSLYIRQVRGRSSATQQTFHVGVGRGAYYWRFVEFGTVHMAARPFLRQAFEANKQRAVDAIAERIRQRIAAVQK